MGYIKERRKILITDRDHRKEQGSSRFYGADGPGAELTINMILIRILPRA